VGILQAFVKAPLRFFYFLTGTIFHQDDRIAKRLFDYFPSYHAAFGEGMNQICRILRRRRSGSIQGVVIEPTDLCNLRCRHCGTQKIAADKKGFMKMDLFKRLLDENKQLSCIILTRNGEPLMHPKIFEMIKYARGKKIYVAMFTNGLLLNDGRIEKLFESGLNEINFSMEGINAYYEHNRGADYNLLKSIIMTVLRKRKERNSFLKVGINSAVTDKLCHAENVKKEWGALVDHINVEPLMGQKSKVRRAPCRTLWRNLVITWNGDVLPCCVDMKKELLIGNINNKPLRQIFNDLPVRNLRKHHLEGRYPETCKHCDPYFG